MESESNIGGATKQLNPASAGKYKDCDRAEIRRLVDLGYIPVIPAGFSSNQVTHSSQKANRDRGDASRGTKQSAKQS